MTDPISAIRDTHAACRPDARTTFTNPVIAGEFVYHCHIVQHADQGMMANIFVAPPGIPSTPGHGH